MNNNFTFTGSQRTLTFALMAIGLLALLFGVFTSPEGTHQARVWSNILHNTAFFMGIAFISTFLIACKISAYSGWHTNFKRILEAFSMFLPIGLLLVLIIVAGLWTGSHHLYHWAADGITDPNSANYDSIIDGKSKLLNPIMYTVGTLGIIGLWTFFAFKFRSLSVSEDKDDHGVGKHEGSSYWRSSKVWAAIFLPVGGFLSPFVILWLIMSIDSHWYSTMFFWYTSASWLVTAVAFTILFIIYLKSLGHLQQVSDEHLHDLGKYLFGFSVFWTYLWFSQFMLIWYANVGEETIYFHTRTRQFPVLFYGNLIMNFALPFLILVANSTKRMYGIMTFMAVLLIFGHWIDFFQMIKPGVYEGLHHHSHDHGDGHGSIIDLDGKPVNVSKYQKDGEPVLVQNDHGHDHKDGKTHNHDHDHGDGKAHNHDHGDGHHHAGDGHDHEGKDAHGHDHGAHDAHGKDKGHDHGHGEHAAHGHDDGHHGGGHGDHGAGGFEMGYHLPGFIEIGMFLGFLGLFLYVVFTALSRASLIPVNDTYHDESTHHHV